MSDDFSLFGAGDFVVKIGTTSPVYRVIYGPEIASIGTTPVYIFQSMGFIEVLNKHQFEKEYEIAPHSWTQRI